MTAKCLYHKSKEEWLASRAGGIGSSDVAAIMGLNPYKSPYQLWLEKTGQMAPADETMAMVFGNAFEDGVAQLFERASGRTIIKSSAKLLIYQHPTYEWARVSPDRTYWIGEGRNVRDNSQKGVLECKTTGRRIASPEDIPTSWYLQLQFQLGVMGMQSGALAWASFAPRDFGYIDYDFKEDVFELIIKECELFYTNNILGGEPPDMATVKDVSIQFPIHLPGKCIEADAVMAEKIDKLRAMNDCLKNMSNEVDMLKNELKIVMQDAERIEFDGTTLIEWKTTAPTKRVNLDALRADHPDICAKYEVAAPCVRRFIVK